MLSADQKEIISAALLEDIREGDHTSLACVENDTQSAAKLYVKEPGICCGMAVAREVFAQLTPCVTFIPLAQDGCSIAVGDILFEVRGSARSILSGERTALNFLQRMSGIATETSQYVALLQGTSARLLDTRKTTPLLRSFEKYAVKIGGGENHRFGLYDMIMIKDNHIDFAGGIVPAIDRTINYLKNNNKQSLRIEIEVRNFEELEQVLRCGGVHRIMLDNFSPSDLKLAVNMIDKRYETEASGGITKANIRLVAETGVDFISVGALTHHIQSLDLSLVSA